MEFGKHLAKGFWGLADKALPAVYGIGYVFLVIRVLPAEEFGNFVLIQEIFLVISGLATGLALQPLLKFTAERSDDDRDILGSTLFLYTGFLLLCSVLFVVFRLPFSDLLNAPALRDLMLYLPAMIAASFVRNIALSVLQARFLFARVFWIDAIHFLGAPLLTLIWSAFGLFHSALDLIIINIITLTASSVVGLVLSRSLLGFTVRPRREVLRSVTVYGTYSLGGISSYLVYTKADTFLLSAFTGPLQVAVYNSVKIFTRLYETASQVLQMFVLPAASRFSSQQDRSQVRVLVEKAVLFSTLGLIPVLVLFLLGPSLVIQLIYGGRYAEAIPVLQVFSLLSLFVPLFAVASNTLLGLGEAKASFILGVQMLVISLVAYLVFIPFLGGTGAAIGNVVTSFVMAWLAAVRLNKEVPVSARGIMLRIRDITAFVRRQLNTRNGAL